MLINLQFSTMNHCDDSCLELCTGNAVSPHSHNLWYAAAKPHPESYARIARHCPFIYKWAVGGGTALFALH